MARQSAKQRRRIYSGFQTALEEQLATANKTPPVIAPGILCPKCKGPVTDERANKRTEKSPDYQCANVLCTDASGKYRTGIWAEKSNGSAGGVASSEAPEAPSVAPLDKPKLTAIYKQATEFVLKDIVPLYEKAEIGMTDTTVAACVQTLFIAASKER